MIGSIAFLASAHATCGDRSALLDLLERQVTEGRIDEGEATSRTIVESLGCGPLAQPEQIARLWLAEAVMLAVRGEREASDQALASAARLSTGAWRPIYGEALKMRLEQASHLPPPGSGELRVESLYAGYLAAVDGVAVLFPVTLSSGLHLLQIGTSSSSMSVAIRFAQPPGLDLVIDPKLPLLDIVPSLSQAPLAEAPVAEAEIHDGPRPRKRRILQAFALGGVSALLYGATWTTYYAVPADTRGPGLYTATHGLWLASIGTGAASAGLLVWGIATPAIAPAP